MGSILILIVWAMIRLLDDPVPFNGERVDVDGEKRRSGRVD